LAWGADSWRSTTNVPGGNDYVGIAAGFFHGLALREDGSLVGWGHNGDGQS
jgi:alpha-tubulin suppressor-like RCC1 family protein